MAAFPPASPVCRLKPRQGAIDSTGHGFNQCSSRSSGLLTPSFALISDLIKLCVYSVLDARRWPWGGGDSRPCWRLPIHVGGHGRRGPSLTRPRAGWLALFSSRSPACPSPHAASSRFQPLEGRAPVPVPVCASCRPACARPGTLTQSGSGFQPALG